MIRYNEPEELNLNYYKVNYHYPFYKDVIAYELFTSASDANAFAISVGDALIGIERVYRKNIILKRRQTSE